MGGGGAQCIHARAGPFATRAAWRDAHPTRSTSPAKRRKGDRAPTPAQAGGRARGGGGKPPPRPLNHPNPTAAPRSHRNANARGSPPPPSALRYARPTVPLPPLRGGGRWGLKRPPQRRRLGQRSRHGVEVAHRWMRSMKGPACAMARDLRQDLHRRLRGVTSCECPHFPTSLMGPPLSPTRTPHITEPTGKCGGRI
jgi:hypothetical protein